MLLPTGEYTMDISAAACIIQTKINNFHGARVRVRQHHYLKRYEKYKAVANVVRYLSNDQVEQRINEALHSFG